MRINPLTPVSHKQARNLLKAGYEVTVWNRNPEKCKPLAEEGAKVSSNQTYLKALMMKYEPVPRCISVVFTGGRVCSGCR